MVIFLLSAILFFQDDLPLTLNIYDPEARAIIIFAPDNRSAEYEQSLYLLTKDPIGLDQRNVLIFEIFASGGIGPGGESFSEEQVNAIRTYYQADAQRFMVLLTRKHFEEILRSEKPMQLDDIFQSFDQEE